MELKATEAREIDKKKVTDPDYTAINGRLVADIKTGEQMKAGDFYLVHTSNPTLIAIDPPQGIVNWLWWQLTDGTTEKEIIETVTRAIISCPFCGLPIITDSDLPIVHDSPLTIEGKIFCPYAPKEIGIPHAFEIKEGKITPA